MSNPEQLALPLSSEAEGDALITTALEHIKSHHDNSDGYITLAKKGEKFTQRNFRYNEIPAVLEEWIGEDTYFSMNTFYRPRRLVENIRQLRSLYVDVDCYLFNYAPEWVIGKMELELFGQSVPEPNLIIHSGRGFNVVWQIDAVPYKALPLWQVVEDYLTGQFKAMGGDLKATDAARVFRIAGSTNSKSGEAVTVQYRHNNRYKLRDIQHEYLPELDPSKKKTGRPAKVTKLFKLLMLYWARRNDLVKLVEMRGYNVYGYRETICFLYRYWGCCYTKDPDQALEETLELNQSFMDPLPEREVIKATKSAETAWAASNNKEADALAKSKGYPGAGYNISNNKLISWLDITEEEQKQLSTIIGTRTKYDRNNVRRAQERRAAGKQTREEYEATAADRRSQAVKMRKDGMSLRDIAKDLGISHMQVKRMIEQV